MSETNGAGTFKKHIDDSWEVVVCGTNAFIGGIVSKAALPELEGPYVTMRPCLIYVSNPNIQQTPQGFGVNGQTRFALPLEMMASDPPQRIRWDRRYRIADFDKDDQATFEAAVAKAFEAKQTIRAERSGLSLVPGLPKGMPPAPGMGRS